MRFTTGQEPGDWAELWQDRLPDGLNESVMAAANCPEPVDAGCVEEGSMISNLPLLFADGYPTSLEKITLPQLERFITFMVQCSLGHDTAKVIGEPQWWPKEIKFTNPFVRPHKVNELQSWMGNLKKLVFRCYTYHRSEYLLRFCSHLAQHPHDKLEYVNNWDSTTSLFHKSTGKLLVTFRNENMNYDKKIESPRRLLLQRNVGTSGPPSKTKQQQQMQSMIQPVLCDDIYLCDNCDAEFDGYKKMKEHEKMCCEQEQSSESSRPGSPEVSVEPQPVQSQFLEYFGLSSNETDSLPKKASTEAATNIDGIRSSRRIRGSVNLARCPTIPFSSPAGIAMAKKSRTMTEVTQQERLERIERYLLAPPLSNGSRPRWLDRVADGSRWTVSHKPNRDKPIQHNYVHQYKFNSFRGKPILSIRSQILCVSCRRAIVPVNLLTPEQIDDLKRNPQKYVRPKRRGIVRISRGPRPAPKSKRQVVVNSLASNNPKEGYNNPGDMNDPIIIDDEELATLTSVQQPLERIVEDSRNETPVNTDTKNLETTSQKTEVASQEKMITELLSITRSETEPKFSPPDDTTSTTINENIVAVIDLCSSDDDEGNSTRVKNLSSDENRDPINGDQNGNLTSDILTNFLPSSKISVDDHRHHHRTTCIYPTNTNGDWLKINPSLVPAFLNNYSNAHRGN